jgi:hypothetical protein
MLVSVAVVFIAATLGLWWHDGADAQRRMAPGVVALTSARCGQREKQEGGGEHTFLVDNATSGALAVALVGAHRSAVYGAIPALAAGARRSLKVALPPGGFWWRCRRV